MKIKSLFKLCLYFCVLFLGAQYSLASSSACVKALSEKISKKYNSNEALKFNFTDHQLKELRKLYHGLPVPEFVSNISRNQDLSMKAIADISSQFMERSKDGLAVFVPNAPVYHSAEEYMSYINEGRFSEFKNNPNGITLSTWYMHPNLAGAPVGSHPVIADLEKNSLPYLASMLDLHKTHLPHLKELERLSLSHVRRVYGVRDNDKVEIYFHFPYAPKTVTLHLHIRVNQHIYGLERAKSYSLKDIIRVLENGGQVDDLILERQKNLGGLYTNYGTAEDLVRESLVGEVQETENPFYKE